MMKKRIGFCGLVLIILGFIVGGVVSVEALEPRTNIQSPSKAIVPNVIGIPSDLALQILQLAGFSGKIQRGSSRSLTVESQKPTAGAFAATNSIIVLGVGNVTLKKSGTENSSESLALSRTRQTDQTIVIQGGQVQSSSGLGLRVTLQQTTMKPIMAWYPQRFLTGEAGVKTQRLQNILRSQPGGSGVPIIMTPTQGWQYGWTH